MDTTVEDRIRARAYELWESDGCPQGRDLDYWSMAEREILEEPIAAARALADQVVTANLPKLAKRAPRKAKVA
jgi:hypothetical protein